MLQVHVSDGVFVLSSSVPGYREYLVRKPISVVYSHYVNIVRSFKISCHTTHPQRLFFHTPLPAHHCRIRCDFSVVNSFLTFSSTLLSPCSRRSFTKAPPFSVPETWSGPVDLTSLSLPPRPSYRPTGLRLVS